MNAALRLVAHTIRPIAGFPEEVLSDGDLIKEALKIAKANKVLLAFGEELMRKGVELPEPFDGVLRHNLDRQTAYKTMLEEIAWNAYQAGIEFMVVKSKPFSYVGDDVDFLLRNRDSVTEFSSLLTEVGFSEIGHGPAAATFAKTMEKIRLMADVHIRLAASYMPYVDGTDVWARRVRREVHGSEVFTPCVEDEIRILAGHSLQKELRLNLAEFFAVWHYLQDSDIRKLFRYARQERTNSILSVFLISVNEVSKGIYNVPLIERGETKPSLLERIASSTVTRDWGTQPRMPYQYHATLPLVAFFERLVDETANGGRTAVDFLRNALKMPFTNREGLRILLNHIRARHRQQSGDN